ncbi:MAG: hypothetical protein ACE5JX_15395, partial [Acidobacteriota bacterium]
MPPNECPFLTSYFFSCRTPKLSSPQRKGRRGGFVQSKEPPRLKHPLIRVFWFTGRAFTEGIERHELDGVNVRAYGAAKTVADCFKYRNKLAIDTALEALKLFLRDRRGS